MEASAGLCQAPKLGYEEHGLEKRLMEQGARVSLRVGNAVQGGWSSVFHGWGTVEEESLDRRELV